MEIQDFIDHFAEYPFVLFFLAALLGGEEIIFPLAFLVGRAWWDLELLILGSFIGTMVSDLAWFLLGRHGIQKTKFFQKHTAKYEIAKKLFQKLAKHEFNLMLITKFIYGTRIMTIFHLSIGGMSIIRFLSYSACTISLWLNVVIGIGWWAGKGSVFLNKLYEHPASLVLSLISLLVLFHIARHLISKKIGKKLTT